MSKKKIIAILSVTSIIGATLTGCWTKTEPPPPKPQEFAHVPVFVAASAIPGDSQEKVLYDSQLKAYAVGRYIDPANGTVMHEQHTIYRIEQMPRWNLMPQPDADPVMRAQREQRERYANALSGQLSLAVRDMQTAKDQVEQLIARQSGDQERAAEFQVKLDDMTKKFGTVSDNVLKSSETIRKLETELRKLQKESEVMKLQLKRNREFTNEK